MWKEKIMSENNQSKRSRCRYCFPSMRKNGKEFHCVVDGWEDENVKNYLAKTAKAVANSAADILNIRLP